MTDPYDVVAVGTGFASTFFVHEALKFLPPAAKVLFLERGPNLNHAEHRTAEADFPYGSYRNLTPDKPWNFVLAHGGSSNRWTGNVPRQLPEDFALHTRHGVGVDWPLSYDDLEEFYCDVEELMGVSGSDKYGPVPRSRPYPNPPHRMTDPGYALAHAFPDSFFAMPCARPTRPTRGRAACCASMQCRLCPVDAKFTILNGMAGTFDDPRVEVRYGAMVTEIDRSGDLATGVRYVGPDGQAVAVKGDFIALGANAIFNSHLLLRSGFDDANLGRGLVEQAGRTVVIDLDGMDSGQGTTIHTGLGYMHYEGPHRKERAAALVESSNMLVMREERGRWRQRHVIRFIFEDLPQDHNRVRFDEKDPDRPVVEFHGVSDYTQRGLDAVPELLQPLLDALPVESVEIQKLPRETEHHVQGACVMGTDPKTSVVDRQCVHHQVRNLAVLGASAFPTCPAANPTLSLAALSLWSARRLFGPTSAP